MMSAPNRLAWRLGFRLAARSPLRSALVCLTIAIPVGVGVAVAGLTATVAVSLPEATAAAFGTATGRVVTVAGFSSSTRTPGEVIPPLPNGSALSYDQDVLGLPITGPAGLMLTSDGRVMDVADPLTRGVYRIDVGVPVDQPNTVLLSSAVAQLIGISSPGQTVQIGGYAWTVSALLTDRLNTDHKFFVLPPTAAVTIPGQAALAAARALGSPRWFVAVPPDTNIADLNTTLSKANLSYVPSSQASALASPAPLTDSTALLIALGLLAETVLLVSAAFAVVVRTERRHMGLLAAMGAPTSVTSRFFLAHALFLGTVGSILGLLAGQIGGYLLVGPLSRRAAADWGPWDPAWLTAVVIVVATLLATTIAARLPARRAVGEDPITLLRAIPPVSVGRTVNTRVAGVLCLALAVTAVLVALISDGIITALAAFLVFTSGIVGTILVATALASRLNSTPLLRFPLPLRVAARSLLAFPARSAITLTALGLVVSVAGIVLIAAASISTKQGSDYRPNLPANTAIIVLPRPLTAVEAGQLTDSVGASGISTGYHRASGIQDGHPAVVAALTDYQACIKDRDLIRPNSPGFGVCNNTSLSRVFNPAIGIADGAGAQVIAGALTATQLAAYDRGESAVVVSTLGFDLTGASPHVALTKMARGPRGFELTEVSSLAAAVPANAAGQDYLTMPKVLISPVASRALKLVPTGQITYFLRGSAQFAPQRIGESLPIDVRAQAQIATEQGPSIVATLTRLQSIISIGAMATTLVIAAGMISLWAADLQGDYRMLGAVGASTRWKRATSASLSITLVCSGVTIGLIWGVLGATIFLVRVSTPVTIPAGWLTVTAGGAIIAAGTIGAIMVPGSARGLRRA